VRPFLFLLFNPSIFIDAFGTKKSTTARGATSPLGLPQKIHEVIKLSERVGIHGIVHPSAIASILNKARFLEHLQMK
jgi:hypothetical protein